MDDPRQFFKPRSGLEFLLSNAGVLHKKDTNYSRDILAVVIRLLVRCSSLSKKSLPAKAVLICGDRSNKIFDRGFKKSQDNSEPYV